jgi:3-phosphoshikimate 1-carboxyvinyltransferase
MVAPYAREGVELQITTDLNSQPYVDMTLGLLAEFGVQVERVDPHCFRIQPSCYHAREVYFVEPDASAASIFFAAPALCGGHVCVEGLRRDSIQGDIHFWTCWQRWAAPLRIADMAFPSVLRWMVKDCAVWMWT